ncbi:MAG TPA: hypothetical protein VJS90_18975 [Pseudomonas sp.]|uniref:hypothetical protein n=1 Tax=Pseudomonas sp. TaxID=306 RepID=UPI002B47CBA4|nr:hypothetical protein [Pseudomonas sp.]HKS15118.1 hypothetical protein [Pseudomonas sp.]
MPLMIDAIPLLPCLQRVEIYATAARTAIELMVNAEGDEYIDLAEQALVAHKQALVELAQLTQALVTEADVPRGVTLTKG